MLAKRIIPCLDVTAGRVVKGVNFVGLRDAGDPVAVAARYNEQGADELTFLDITATSDGRDLILHIIEAVASQVFIPLTVGARMSAWTRWPGHARWPTSALARSCSPAWTATAPRAASTSSSRAR